MKTRQIIVLSSVSLGISGAAFAGVTQIDVIARVGDVAPGGEGATFTTFNPPFVNSLGQVGFTGNLSEGGPFVFHTDSVVWLNHFAPKGFTLTGTEATMGISDAGGFIYSPNTNGTDSVWTHNGLLLRGSDPAPGMPGMFATFSSRPRMLPDGTAVWVAGMRDTPDSQTSQGRILYVCADTSDPSSSVPALHTQQQFDVGGNFFTPTTSGIGFNFDASDNAQYLINELVLAGLPTSSNTFVWINGNLVHRQADPVGDGTNWNSFRGLGINNNGDYCFGGATSGGPTATNEFLAYSGQIIARRGDTLDGIELASNWATRWTSINNLGQIAHLWEGGSGLSLSGTLFVTMNPGDVAGSTVALVSAWQELDTTGDGQPDAVISDFKASATIAPGLDFSDHPWVYVEVDLRDILTATGGLGTAYEAIIRVPFPTGSTCPADLNNSGSVDVQDLLILLGAWGPCGKGDCPADLNNSGSVDVQDLLILLGAWGPCNP